EEIRPPLANQLFERRPLFEEAIARYWECTSIVPRLRTLRSNIGLEEELDAIAGEASKDDRRAVQLNGVRYYIRDVISNSQVQWSRLTRDVTNYAALLDQIWNWHLRTGEAVRLVTFNYDTLLDRACSLAVPGLTFSTMES